MSVSRRLKIHYIYGKSNRCHDMSPLYGGCPLLGESVMRGFTVVMPGDLAGQTKAMPYKTLWKVQVCIYLVYDRLLELT